MSVVCSKCSCVATACSYHTQILYRASQIAQMSLSWPRRPLERHSSAKTTQTTQRLSSSSTVPSDSPTAITSKTLSEDGVPPLPFSDIPGPRGVGQWPIIGALVLFRPFSEFLPIIAIEFLSTCAYQT